MTANRSIPQKDFDAVIRRATRADGDLETRRPIPLGDAGDGLAEAILCTGADFPPGIHRWFDRLRWGGHVVCVCQSPQEAAGIGEQLSRGGFEITQKPCRIAGGWLGGLIPFFSRKVHYLAARKVELVQPGQSTDRFTYHVRLERSDDAGDYVVVKEVPTLEMVTARLRGKWPDLAGEIIEKRARKFTEKIFPVFLTREAAILKIVNRDLPKDYAQRVPRLLGMEQDDRGFARRLRLSWLRNGGQPLSQWEFARQSADLLRALHDDAGVMHLDLRLDNFVVTPAGIGFVDFGSAVRVDENLKQSPLLSSLFEELMRTSEIQRMLFRMTRTGEVTSEAISGGLHKVDKAVDCFYLAVQISSPHANPDLKDLILFEKQGSDARRLSRLTEQILRPANPAHPAFRTAADILRGIEQLKATQSERTGTPAPGGSGGAVENSEPVAM